MRVILIFKSFLDLAQPVHQPDTSLFPLMHRISLVHPQSKCHLKTIGLPSPVSVGPRSATNSATVPGPGQIIASVIAKSTFWEGKRQDGPVPSPLRGLKCLQVCASFSLLLCCVPLFLSPSWENQWRLRCVKLGPIIIK